MFLPLLKHTRNNISISTLWRHFGNSENCGDFTITVRQIVYSGLSPVCYTARTQQPDRPRPFRMPPVPFLRTRTYRFTPHIRFPLTTQRHASQTGRFTSAHFFPSPRMFYKRRCARDGSGGTCRRGCKKTGGVRRLRVSRCSSYSGRAIAQPALILWVMHFAIVRLFYFVICYSSVLPLAPVYVEVEYTRHRSAQSGIVRLRWL